MLNILGGVRFIAVYFRIGIFEGRHAKFQQSPPQDVFDSFPKVSFVDIQGELRLCIMYTSVDQSLARPHDHIYGLTMLDLCKVMCIGHILDCTQYIPDLYLLDMYLRLRDEYFIGDIKVSMKKALKALT